MGGPVFTGKYEETERAIALLAGLALKESEVAGALAQLNIAAQSVAKKGTAMTEGFTCTRYELRSKAVASITKSKRFSEGTKEL